MDFPVRGEERGDVGFGKEIGRSVGTVKDADLPGMAVFRDKGCRQRQCFSGRLVTDMQDVAGHQRPAAMTAELAQREGGPAAEIFGYVNAALTRR